MKPPHQATVTALLVEARNGDDQALQRLFPLVYQELYQLAQQRRRRWHGDYTLNTTALVHEAYIKLVDQTQAPYENRAHFLGVAAKAMRHILLDYAKGRKREKRGGDLPKRSLEALQDGTGLDHLLPLTMDDEQAATLIDLDTALTRLEQVSPRQARIVECRFFGGLTIEETANTLDLSTATVKRGWAMAQAWLFRALRTPD